MQKYVPYVLSPYARTTGGSSEETKEQEKQHNFSAYHILEQRGCVRSKFTDEGQYKVIEARGGRGLGEELLGANFRGIRIPLRWSKWTALEETIELIRRQRSEIVQRLFAEKCERCGAPANLEAHHARKLADLSVKGQSKKGNNAPRWVSTLHHPVRIYLHIDNVFLGAFYSLSRERCSKNSDRKML